MAARLSMWNWKIVDLAERQRKAGEAQACWKHAYAILSAIDKRGLQLSPEDRQ